MDRLLLVLLVCLLSLGLGWAGEAPAPQADDEYADIDLPDLPATPPGEDAGRIFDGACTDGAGGVGIIKAYTDELSQQYAGANGAHRMKEALWIQNVSMVGLERNSDGQASGDEWTREIKKKNVVDARDIGELSVMPTGEDYDNSKSFLLGRCFKLKIDVGDDDVDIDSVTLKTSQIERDIEMESGSSGLISKKAIAAYYGKLDASADSYAVDTLDIVPVPTDGSGGQDSFIEVKYQVKGVSMSVKLPIFRVLLQNSSGFDLSWNPPIVSTKTVAANVARLSNASSAGGSTGRFTISMNAPYGQSQLDFTVVDLDAAKTYNYSLRKSQDSPLKYLDASGRLYATLTSPMSPTSQSDTISMIIYFPDLWMLPVQLSLVETGPVTNAFNGPLPWFALPRSSGAVNGEVTIAKDEADDLGETDGSSQWQMLHQRAYKFKIIGGIKDDDATSLDLKYAGSTETVLLNKISDNVRISEEFIPTRNLGSGEIGYLQSLNLKPLVIDDNGPTSFIPATYNDFVTRKRSDKFDLFLYGNKPGNTQDRLRFIVECTDGMYDEDNTVTNAVSVQSSVTLQGDRRPASSTWIVLQKNKVGQEDIPEKDRIEQYYNDQQNGVRAWKTAIWPNDADFNKWGPWDPASTAKMMPLLKDNLNLANFEGKHVVINTHGSDPNGDYFLGTVAEWDQWNPSAISSPALYAALNKESKIVAADFNFLSGSKKAPLILLAACNALKGVAQDLYGFSWTGSVVGREERASGNTRPVIGFVDGVSKEEQARIAVQFKYLLSGIVINLTADKMSPGNIPDSLVINSFGASYYEPGDYPKGQAGIKTGRTYRWEWNDHYQSSVKDVITLTLDDPVLLPSLDASAGIGYVMATMTSEIHGVVDPFTFPLAFLKKANGEYTVYSAIATSDGIPASGNMFDYPLSQATGPGIKGLADFGKAWYRLFKYNSAKVTHAYWDSYMTKYRGLTGNPRITDEVPPDLRQRLKALGTVYFERTYPAPKATVTP